MQIDETKAEKMKNIDSLNMKISAITSTKPTLYFEQPSADLIKRSLLKPPGKYSHASQFTNYLSSLNHQVATLLQIKITGCHFICMITIPINKQHLANIQITQKDKLQSLTFFLPLHIHPKSDTAKEYHQKFSGSLRVHFVKYANIHS